MAHITQKPSIVIKVKELPPENLDVLLSEDYKKEQAEYHRQANKLVKLAESAPELVGMLDSLLFIAESVAHLKGLEREILPTTDAIREKLAKLV